MEQMKVKLVSEYAQLPTRGNVNSDLPQLSAGLDLYCPFNVRIPADSKKKIPLGVSFRLGKGSEYETNHKGKIKQLEELVNQLVAEVEELKAGK